MHKTNMKSGIFLPAVTLALFWLGAVTVPGVQAGDLRGRQDPALQAAVDVWLQDNDEDSLPVFARLAADGNIAARMLLARIEATDQAPGNFVNSLSRKQRVELFRSSTGKGMFRPTWLKSEKKEGNQFASVLLDSTALAVKPDTIRALYEIGEPEAAYDLIREAAGNGSAQQKQELAEFLPLDSELMPYLRALQNPAADFTVGHAALQHGLGSKELKGPTADTRAAAQFVEYGYQTGVQNSEFDRSNYYYTDLAGWIESAPVTAPIANLCRRVCGEDTGDCAITAFGVVGGYYKAIRFDSPLQTLIEQAHYVASDRAIGMVTRRVAFARAAGASEKPLISDDELNSRSACLASAVLQVRAGAN